MTRTRELDGQLTAANRSIQIDGDSKNSRLLAEQLPHAELRIYLDANHSFLDQYPEQFADDIAEFLNR